MGQRARTGGESAAREADTHSHGAPLPAVHGIEIEDQKSISHDLGTRSKFLLGLATDQRRPLREQSRFAESQRSPTRGEKSSSTAERAAAQSDVGVPARLSRAIEGQVRLQFHGEDRKHDGETIAIEEEEQIDGYNLSASQLASKRVNGIAIDRAYAEERIHRVCAIFSKFVRPRCDFAAVPTSVELLRFQLTDIAYFSTSAFAMSGFKRRDCCSG